MTPTSLSPAQKKVLAYYQAYADEHDTTPTYAQAAAALDVSQSVIFFHMTNLIKKGLIKKEGNGTIAVPGKSNKYPLLGRVACGQPIDVQDDVQDELEVPSFMLKASDTGYLLEAQGNSMRDAGIMSGDLLVIKDQADALDGDIAVVVTAEDGNEQATLKQIFHTPKGLLLKPKNPIFAPVLRKECIIRGKLVGTMRVM